MCQFFFLLLLLIHCNYLLKASSSGGGGYPANQSVQQGAGKWVKEDLRRNDGRWKRQECRVRKVSTSFSLQGVNPFWKCDICCNRICSTGEPQATGHIHLSARMREMGSAAQNVRLRPAGASRREGSDSWARPCRPRMKGSPGEGGETSLSQASAFFHAIASSTPLFSFVLFFLPFPQEVTLTLLKRRSCSWSADPQHTAGACAGVCNYAALKRVFVQPHTHKPIFTLLRRTQWHRLVFGQAIKSQRRHTKAKIKDCCSPFGQTPTWGANFNLLRTKQGSISWRGFGMILSSLPRQA